MATKHFFKILTIFSAMIIIGLLGVFISNTLDKGAAQAIDEKTDVAK